jgi:uncharacterized Zn finger protein
MVSVADLVHEEALRELAEAGAYDEGTKWADQQRLIELAEFGPLRVTGWVHGCEVELRSTGDELAWSCSCPSAGTQLCAHVVALAIETWRRAP